MKNDPTGARPLELPEPIGEERADALRALMAIVDRLRDPDGCPWDREQTLGSVAPHLVEESHELVEAVETGDEQHVVEEAGDLLMGVFLLSRIAQQEGRFDLARVATGVSDKLVRRHPHVFGDGSADSSAAALVNWEAAKKKERQAAQADASALAGVPKALPALQRARRLCEKAIAAGFKWSDAEGALEKVHEETRELAEAFEERASAGGRERLEHELGDLLIAAAILGTYVEIDPERALRQALRRFERRFRALEQSIDGPLADCTPERLTEVWQEVKRTLDEEANG
jgi:MazG family protein